MEEVGLLALEEKHRKKLRFWAIGNLSNSICGIPRCQLERFTSLGSPFVWFNVTAPIFEIRGIIIYHSSYKQEELLMLSRIRRKYPLLPIILVTEDEDTAEGIINAELCDFVVRDPDALSTALDRLAGMQDGALKRLSLPSSFSDVLRAISAVRFRHPEMSHLEALNLIAKASVGSPTIHCLCRSGELQFAA